MNMVLTVLATNKNIHKISACVIGIVLWVIISALHTTTVTVSVPLCFFDETTASLIPPKNVPSSISVTLAGSKQALRSVDMRTLAAHVNAQHMRRGERLHITEKNLFLPETITVINYSPNNLGA